MVNHNIINHKNALVKGISPVVATILMVMITVVLVAFSYSWLQTTVTGTQDTTSDVMAQADKLNQKVDISTVYQCGANICFELKAYTTNSYSVPMNSTTYYIHDVPKAMTAWDGGVSGTACNAVGLSLAPGGRCYGMIEATSCQLAQNDFKISLSWGATTSKSISGCN